jgi:hypothetical protein
MQGENQRETGGRVPVEHPEIRRQDRTHTGDRGDEPKLPHGLAEPVDEVDDKTHQSDGVESGTQPKE